MKQAKILQERLYVIKLNLCKLKMSKHVRRKILLQSNISHIVQLLRYYKIGFTKLDSSLQDRLIFLIDIA